MSTDGSERLSQLVSAAIEDAVENAYPSDEAGLIDLTIREMAGKLELRVRDFGFPPEVAEFLLGVPKAERHGLVFGIYGQNGKPLSTKRASRCVAAIGRPLASLPTR